MSSATVFIAYSDLAADPLIAALIGDYPDDRVAAERILFETELDPGKAVAQRVLASTGPFATAARRGLSKDDPRRAQAAEELTRLGDLAYRVTTQWGQGRCGDDFLAGDSPACRVLRRRLAEQRQWGDLVHEVARFHVQNGTGALATHRVLRFGDGALLGVEEPDPISPHDLIAPGPPERLSQSLKAFTAGGPAVDALLYGPPGTGKSATVRALAHASADDGLRLVQVDRDQVRRIPELFRLLARGPRCLVLLDDLVFDDDARDDRALRAALEGDVGARPSNVVVWATSNRMRLVHETHTERENDVEAHLGRGERAALASRFALRVNFPALSPDEFTAMAIELVRRRGGRIEDTTPGWALAYARDHGLTPRTAQHFAAVATSHGTEAQA